QQAAHAAPSLEVKVNGARIPADYNIVSVVAYLAVNRLAYARMSFLDGEVAKSDFSLSNRNDFLPGSEVEILAGYKGSNQTIFKGIVVKHVVRLKGNKSTFLTVDCRHAAVKATKVRKRKIFTDLKDSDIFSTIFQSYSIPAGTDDTAVEHHEMVQFNSTDWDFVVSRAEANGMLVMTDHDGVRIAKPDFSADPIMDLTFGFNVLEFDAEMHARHQFDRVKAAGWDPAVQTPVESEGSLASGFIEQGNMSSADLASKTGQATFDCRNASPLTETELRTWADARMLKFNLSKIRGR